jgi:hypothetical protein
MHAGLPANPSNLTLQAQVIAKRNPNISGAGNSALLYMVSTGTASDGFRKVVKGLSKIAKDKEGLAGAD